MTVPVSRAGARWPRPEILLLLLFGAHVLLKIALFPQVAHTPVEGDEAAYVDGARALSNLVRDLASLGPLDSADLQRNVVGSGWFMPGMSVLLTPLFVVDPDASITAIRAYLGVASTLLLVFTVISVRRVLGHVYAGLVLVFPGLVPMWLLFSYAAWGDLTAGLLILLFVVELIVVFRGLRNGIPPTLRQGAQLGLVAVATVYFRSSTTLLVAGLCAVLLLAILLVLRSQDRRRGVAALAATVVVFVAVLLPWSVFASRTLGGRVVTTTSVPVVLANTFGDRDRLCFGPCDPGSTIWFTPLRYSREVARATGRSELEVQQEMSTYARTDVTPHSYARDVLANLGRYVGDPAYFALYLRPSPPSSGGAVYATVVATTDVMFFAMLAVALAMLLAVWRRSFQAQVVSVLLKLGLGALLAQPFVHIAGARYWMSAAPLLALAAGLLVQVWRESRAPTTPAEPAGIGLTLSRLLTAIQVALAAGIIVLASGILAFAV